MRLTLLLLVGCGAGDPAPPPATPAPGPAAVEGARRLPANLPADLPAGAGGPGDRSDLRRVCESGRRIPRATEALVLSVDALGPLHLEGPLVLFDPLAPQQHVTLGDVPSGAPLASLCRARATPDDGGPGVEKAVALRLRWSEGPPTRWSSLGAVRTWEGRVALADAETWGRAEAQDEAAQRRFEAATAAGRATWGGEDDPLLHPESDVSEVGRRVWSADPQAALRVSSVAGGPVDVIGGPSGFGAGTYHAYAGRDDAGTLVEVVVDLRVLLDPVEASVEVPTSAGAAGGVSLADVGLRFEVAAAGETLPRRVDRPLWFTLREDRGRVAHPSQGEPDVVAVDAGGAEVPLHIQGHGGVWWVERPEPLPATVRISRRMGVAAL